MKTKRSTGYVPYLYTRIKYKSKAVYIKKKQRKELFTFNMISKNKKKQRQRKKNEKKEESYLNYRTIIKYTFCFLIYFHQMNLLNMNLKMCLLCLYLLIYS